MIHVEIRGVQHEPSTTLSTMVGSFSEVCQHEHASCSARNSSHTDRGELSRRGDNRDEVGAFIRTSDTIPAEML